MTTIKLLVIWLITAVFLLALLYTVTYFEDGSITAVFGLIRACINPVLGCS